MGLLAAITGALCVWITLWALGSKGFDAFMVFILLVVTSVTLRMVLNRLPGRDPAKD